MSYLSTRYESDEYVAGVVYSGGNVFAYYHNNHTNIAYRTTAICKLSYLDGQLIYAKQVMYQDYMFTPPEIIYSESAGYLDLDPYDSTTAPQFIATSVLQFGTTPIRGFYGAINILKDENDGLTVKMNYYLRH